MSRTVTGNLPRDGDGSVPARVRAYWSAHYSRVLFSAIFVLPTLLAALYFGLIASDRYVSETRFIVRSIDKPAAQGAAAYLQDFGILRANDEAFAIQDYIHSRDLMHVIMKRIDLRRVWAPAGADFLSRYGSAFFADSDEALFRHFQKQIVVEKDLETGITAVKVNAYDARDAHAIAQMVLAASEARINEMNTRARADTLAVAQRTSADAARQLAEANMAMTSFRQSAGEVDPQRSAGAAIDRGSDLQRELADLKVMLGTMEARAPSNPAIASTRQRIAALSAQAAMQQGSLTGPGPSLAGKVDSLDQLQAKADVAAKTYEAAQKDLASAREEADRQQIFIEQIAAPNLPDTPVEPRRWRYFFTVALLSFWSYLIFYLLVSGSREHLNLH